MNFENYYKTDNNFIKSENCENIANIVNNNEQNLFWERHDSENYEFDDEEQIFDN